MKNPKKVKQGRTTRAAGKAFERKVREDLTGKGWSVCRWDNNVSDGKLVQAKGKFNPFTRRVMNMSAGFSDFIGYKKNSTLQQGLYNVLFIECKMTGKLDKLEKEKAQWYLKNGYCGKFLIASKKKDGRKIAVKYTEVKL